MTRPAMPTPVWIDTDMGFDDLAALENALRNKDVAAFTVLIIVLIFMPQGLLGKPEVEKV